MTRYRNKDDPQSCGCEDAPRIDAPQQEYIINEDIIRIWRNRCMAEPAHTDSDQCKACVYRGKGMRAGCCDFGDSDMEKIFRSHPITKTPSHDRIGSIRIQILQEGAYLIERVNAGMGEWEYVILYCGEYYATAPSEEIARDIVDRAQRRSTAPAATETLYTPAMVENRVKHAAARAREDVLEALMDDLDFLPSTEDSHGIVWVTMRDVQEKINERKQEAGNDRRAYNKT